MRCIIILIGMVVLTSAPANAAPSLTKAQSRVLAAMASAQQRILLQLPLSGPDSADEPKAIDLSGATITVTYWAPDFVLGISTLNDPLLAVISEVQFPASGSRAADPRRLPAKVSWTTSDRCPALAKILPRLDAVAHRFVTPRTKPPRQASMSEFDGGGYLVRIEGDFDAGSVKGGAMTLSGQDDTPIGQWAKETHDALRLCCTPLKESRP